MDSNKTRAKRNAFLEAGSTTEAGTVPEKAQEAAPLRPITAEEQAIAARVAADSSREWETITEKGALDYSLGRDVFELPPPAKKAYAEKNFVFRWIERKQSRLDEFRSKEAPYKWWVCNSVNTPFLAGFFDPILGCVSREDQMLMFQPYWMKMKRDEILQRQNEGIKDIRQKHGETKGDGMSFVAGKEIKEGDRPIVAPGITDDLGEFIDERGIGPLEADE